MRRQLIGHPADRSALRWVVDVLIAVVAGVSTVPPMLHESDTQPHPLATAVVLVVIVAPLILRRSHPVPTFVWVLVTGAAAGLWDQYLIVGLAVFIALYTVSSLQPRQQVLFCVGLVEVAVVAASIEIAGSTWWFDTIFLSGMVAAAAGLGLYAATRRAYLLELHDRADRLERERDQQVALAAAAERARITREMHDIVAHHLIVMVTLSDGAIAATATSPERGIEAMREVSATGRRALTDTRRLLGVLRDSTPHAGAAPRQPVPDLTDLTDLLDRVRAAGLPTTFEVHGDVASLPPAIQLTVYRLVQEALTNTLKHGGSGTRAAVRLRRDDDELHVDVDDDGAGGRAPAPAGPGGGLIGMRERVLAYGGTIDVGPRQPTGWRVAARLGIEAGDPT